MYLTRLMLNAVLRAYERQARGALVAVSHVPAPANGSHLEVWVLVTGLPTPARVVIWDPAGEIPPYVVWMSCDCPSGRRGIPCPHLAAVELRHRESARA